MGILASAQWSNQAEMVASCYWMGPTNLLFTFDNSRAHAFPTFSKPVLITADAEIRQDPCLQEAHSAVEIGTQPITMWSLKHISLSTRGPWASALGSPWISPLQYRHATLMRPSQFHGDPCRFSDKEAEDCVTSAPCRSQVRCEGVVCAQTGTKGHGSGRGSQQIRQWHVVTVVSALA